MCLKLYKQLTLFHFLPCSNFALPSPCTIILLWYKPDRLIVTNKHHLKYWDLIHQSKQEGTCRRGWMICDVATSWVEKAAFVCERFYVNLTSVISWFWKFILCETYCKTICDVSKPGYVNATATLTTPLIIYFNLIIDFTLMETISEIRPVNSQWTNANIGR